MDPQSLIDLYWSKDFLLNISAEVIGLVAEVVVVTIFIGKYFDRRERLQWEVAFSVKVSRILEEHRDMPGAITQMAMAGSVGTPYKIAFWCNRVTDRIRDAFALVPPVPNAKGYVAVEAYLESVREILRKFANEEMPLSTLRSVNDKAAVMANAISFPQPETYLWSEDILLNLERQLRSAEW